MKDRLSREGELESPEGGMLAVMRRGGIRFFRSWGKKNPGVELLSHTLLCSTIVVRPLIDRVRDGNVSFKPAMNTGKKYEMKKGIGGGSVTGVQLSS